MRKVLLAVVTAACLFFPCEGFCKDNPKGKGDHSDYSKIQEWNATFTIDYNFVYNNDVTHKDGGASINVVDRRNAKGVVSLKKAKGYKKKLRWTSRDEECKITGEVYAHSQQEDKMGSGGTLSQIETLRSIGNEVSNCVVSLKIDPVEGIYVFETLSFRFKNTEKITIGKYHIPGGASDTNEKKGAGLAEIRVRWPEKNPLGGGLSISGSHQAENSNFNSYTKAMGFAAAAKLPIPQDSPLNLTWNLSPAGMEDVVVEVKSRNIGNPHCSCKNFAPLEFTAAASKKGGKFQKFIVESSGTKPEIVKNEGGDRPLLIIKGAGRKTGKTFIKAVYETVNKTGKDIYLSKPYEMNFCDDIEKPRFKDGPYTIRDDPKKESFIFDDGIPGALEMIAFTNNIWVNGKEVKEKLKWDISPNEGMFDVEVKQPTEHGGHTAEFRADKMPDTNDKFGKKIVRAEFKNEKCDCESEEAEAKIFFWRDAYNNPNPYDKMPNWAYYWSQTKAGVRGVPFKVVKTMPPLKKMFNLCIGAYVVEGDPNVPAQYAYFDDIIYLTERVAKLYSPLYTPACMNRPRRINPKEKGDIEDRGIDCFAVLLRHENQHRIELSLWWGPKMSNYSCVEDPDGDLVPTDVEVNTPGCNFFLPKSCASVPAFLQDVVSDVELNAYNVGWQWVPGTADKEDWACPGKQCPMEE